MTIINKLGPRHDARARELGFADRKEMRAAVASIASNLSVEDYESLLPDEMTTLLREYALRNQPKTGN